MVSALTRTLFVVGLLAPGLAFAQSDEFDLDDFTTGPTTPEPTVAEEKRALLDEDPNGVELENWEKAGKKRIIKTLQQKNVVKLGRTELGLGVGFVTNDPYVHRAIIKVDGTYHFTEVTALQLEGQFMPNLGTADYKGITRELIGDQGANVAPDISKMQFGANVTLQFAPIYGKVAWGSRIINFDVFGLFGTGLVQTLEDLAIARAENDPLWQSTAAQIHPTLNYGGGIRVLLGKNLGFRVDGRGLSFIETVRGVELEMKNNILVQVSGTYFLGKGN